MSGEPEGLNLDFVRGLPDEGPVVMVNLVRFKTASADGDGSGWDAYLRYSKGFAALMKAVGATILWAGKVEGAAFGDVSGRPWDFVVLVQYPSRRAFLDVLTSADYAKANRHRQNGVEDHLILAADETYSKFPSPSPTNL